MEQNGWLSSWFRSGTEFRIQPPIGGLLPIELKSVVPLTLPPPPLDFTSPRLQCMWKKKMHYLGPTKTMQDFKALSPISRRPAFQAKLPSLTRKTRLTRHAEVLCHQEETKPFISPLRDQDEEITARFPKRNRFLLAR